MLTSPNRSVVASWCRELDNRIRAGEAVRAEDYLARVPDLDTEEALELVYTEFVCWEELGLSPEPAEFLRRFPALRSQLEEQLLVHRALRDNSSSPVPAGGQAVGPYDLVREVGRGGRGVVFAGRDRRDGRMVAIKLLLSGEYSTPDDLALLQHEATVLAQLDHPNLIRIYEAGLAAGQPYLALEYIDGPPLSRVMAEFRDPLAAAGLIETLARAIHHAHLQGVVHRDLKPSNILLKSGARGEEASHDELEAREEANGETNGPRSSLASTFLPKVSDFGLARVLDGRSGRTRTGHIVGTLGYMAPEQAAGTAHQAGPAADVYALGSVLYQLLTGHLPFGEDPSAVTLHRLLHEPPSAPRRLDATIPRNLETVVLKCLEKDPDRRYPTALTLADDLRRYLDGKPVEARRVGTAEAVRRWMIRRPTAAALIGVVVVAAISLAAVGLYYHAQLRAAFRETEGLQRQTVAANADLNTALRETNALRAETRRQLDDTRRVLLAHQLSQLPSLWLREPIRARQLLADKKVCPLDLRDFTWRYFRDLCFLDEQVYGAHKGGTRALVFLPNGQLLSGGADGKIRYWPSPGTQGECGPTLAAHAKAIAGMAVLDAQTFATAGQDRVVKVWKVGAATPIRTISIASGVNGLAADSASGRLAGACDDGTIRVWEVNTGREVAALTGSTKPILAVAFCPDGRSLAAGGRDGIVRLWDIANGKTKAVWAGDAGPVLGLAFARDGKFVLSTGKRGAVRLWNVHRNTSRQLRGHLMPVRGVAVAPDGDRIATGGEDTYLKIWDAATGQELTNLMQRDLAAVAWSPDGQWVAGGGSDGRVEVYRLPSFPPPPVYPHAGNVATLAVRPGGGVVTAAEAGEVRVWDASRAAAPVVQFTVRPHDPEPARPLAVVGGGAPALAVSPDGTTLAVGAGGGDVVLWDLTRRVEAGRLTGHNGNVTAVAFHPDGKYLASGGADKTIRLWDMTARKSIRLLEGHTRSVLAVAWSPDGRRLASGGEDGSVRLWDPATGRPGPVFTGHRLWVLSLAFHPSGRTLASGSRDRTVRLWDVDGVRPPLVLSGYTNWVYSVGFSPDGRTLATASGHYSIDTPGEVKLCDPEAGYFRAILTAVRAPAAFDATGTRLYVGVHGGVAELVGE